MGIDFVHSEPTPPFVDRGSVSQTESEESSSIENAGSLEEKQLRSTLRVVDSLTLEDEYKDNIVQNQLLETSKQQAIKLIDGVLTKVRRYAEKIISLERHYKLLRFKEQDPIVLAEKIKRADQSRTLSHDALISSIHAATRFLNTQFGAMTESRREEWEDEMEENDKTVLRVERVKFSENIIVPSSVNLHDRKQITEWAIRLYKSLTKVS